jgi:uncharacterized protein (TIRG00374 family)
MLFRPRGTRLHSVESSELVDRRPAARPHAAISRRSMILGAAVGIPASCVLLFLSLRHLDAHALRASVASADAFRLALAGGAMWLVYLTQAARWRVIASPSPPLRTGRFLEWVVAAIAVNNVIPGRPGELLRAEWLSRGTGMPRARALASVVVDRGSDVLALVAALALTYPAVQHPSWLDRLGVAAGIAGLVLVALLAGACVVARRAQASPTGRLARLLADLARGIGGALRGFRAVRVGLLSLLAWSAWALAAWLVASSLGIALSPLEVIFVTAVLNLGVALPSSPGFIGTFQWLSVSALGLLGVAHTDAFAFSILLHAVWFVPTTLAGVALALRKLRPSLAAVVPLAQSESHAA